MSDNFNIHNNDHYIDKSPNDNNIYKYLKLENELEIILISNPNSNQNSACTLSVGVGSLYDPPDVLGLSRLVERSLLLSNEKNPDSNDDFSTFISLNGGFLNSITLEDKTSFFYKIDSSCLEESIEKFSNYLISPTFYNELLEREISIIDSEFNSINDENKKNYILLKGCFENDHPFGQFNNGNNKTLKLDDIRIRVIEFYEKYYSSNVMKLCIYGKQPIERLEEISKKYFGLIKNKKRYISPFPKFKLKQPIKFDVASNITDKNILKIFWPVNDENLSFKKNIKNNSASIISYYLGHEAKGSLSACLESLDYCSRLYSFTQSFTIKDINIIGLEINLTKNGIDNIDHVLFLVNQCIRNLNPSQMVKSELKALEIEWKYINNDSSIDLTRVISNNLFFIDNPGQTLKYPKFLFEKENPMEINKILQNYIVPTNMIVILSSIEFKGKTNKANDVFGIQYNSRVIDDMLIDKWKNQFIKSNDLYLPKPNPFLPNDIEIKTKSSTKPHEVYNFNGIKIDWGSESSLNSPYLNIIIKFESPQKLNELFKDDVLFYVLKKCLKECLYQDILYYLELLKYYIKLKDNTLFSYGFSDKLLLALEEIFKFFYSFNISEQKFNKIKEKIEKNYENKLYKDPSLTSKLEIISYIKMNSSLIEDRMKYFNSITHDIFIQEIKKFFKKVNYKIFMFGNIKKEESVLFGKRLNTIINRISIPIKNELNNEIYCLPRGHEFHIKKNSKDPNLKSYYTNILWQIDEKISKKLISITHILVLLINNRLYHELRTVQQFANHIECTPIKLNNRIYLSVFVQSYSKTPDFIIEYIKNYLTSQFTYYFLNGFYNDYFKSTHKILNFLNGNQDQQKQQNNINLSSSQQQTQGGASQQSTQQQPQQQHFNINNNSSYCYQQQDQYNGRINQNQNQIALNYWDNYNVFGDYQYYEKILKTIKKLNFNQIKKVYLKFIYPPSKETCLFIYQQYPKSILLDNLNYQQPQNINNNHYNNNNEKVKLITNDYNSFKLSFIQLANN